MKVLLDQNKVGIEEFATSLENFLKSNTYVVKAIRRNNLYIDGKRSDAVASISYDLIDPSTFASFTVKVLGNAPIIDPDKFAKMEEVVKIKLPLAKTVVKPYRIDYGTASVSIIAPYVELCADEPEVEDF